MNNKYVYGTKENKEFLNEQVNNLLSFGHLFPSSKGSSYYLGDDGTPWKDRPRETWITSRMAHVYSIGVGLNHEGSKELVEKAINGLYYELKDMKNGGWYPGLTKDNEILPTKQCYAHAFVILASTSGILAGVPLANKLLDEALDIFDKYFWLKDEGLSCDTWDSEFKNLDSYRGINANMHTVEAFLAVADVCNNDEYRNRAGLIINHVTKWAKENNYRIPEHFSSTWEIDLNKNIDKKDDPFKPYGATPGHGIEWTRLIIQWAISTYGFDSKEMKEYLDISEKLYNQAIEDAWNSDGEKGICYTTDWSGSPVVHDRMHWTLAEAINTSSILYKLTNNEKYKNDYYEFMEYLDNTVLDHKTGSWFHQLDRYNKLKETVWPGKSDIYHALQSMLIPYMDIDVSICKAVYNKNK